MTAMLVLILYCVALAKATNETDAVPDIDIDTVVPGSSRPRHSFLTPKIDKSSARIIGGEEAVPHSFPYMVALFIPKTSRDTMSCGGSLITKQTVLTAAHCLDGAVRPVTVYLGAHNLRKSEPTKQKFTSSKYHIYEGWTTISKDIAILHLPSPATLSSAVQLIELAKDPSEDYELHDAVLSGWGHTTDKNRKSSDILRTVALPIVANSVCNVAFLNVLTDAHVCISGLGGKASCHGDSGGPLVLNGVQVGLVSFGSMYGCEIGWPCVFTRVTSYLDWIKEHTI